MNFIIALEGLPFIGIALGLFIIAVVIGVKPLIVITFGLLIFVTFFFRNPDRVIPSDKTAVTSPADGTVIKLEKNSDGSTKISIFMSVFNVHVNRIPFDGVVKKIDYNKGTFHIANVDKASLENEQNAVTIEDAKGREIKFVQIAGFVARRIVCHLKEGDVVKKGERFGLIRFGSRLDIYIPQGFSPAVKIGEKVRAGETVLGNLE